MDGVNTYLNIIASIIAILSTTWAIIAFFWRRHRKKNNHRNSSKKATHLNSHRDIQLDILKSKLHKLKAMAKTSDIPFVLIGSVYLDIRLNNVTTRVLERDEWSNISEPKFKLGGSAFLVGKYLSKLYDKKSYLISITGGGNDLLTMEFNRQIDTHKWLLNTIHKDASSTSHAGITFHLVQLNQEYTTMFTHRGILRNLDWAIVNKELANINNAISEGGLIYIAGYTKTNLWNNMVIGLQSLPDNTLVCIDHGRLVQGSEDPNRMNMLRQAYELHLIDVYICTFDELWNYCHCFDNKKSPPETKNVRRTLEKLANTNSLPLITLVRGGNLPGNENVYVIVGDSVFPIQGESGPNIIKDSVGPKNSYNAALLHYLIYGEKLNSFEDEIIDAAQKALRVWQTCKI